MIDVRMRGLWGVTMYVEDLTESNVGTCHAYAYVGLC